MMTYETNRTILSPLTTSVRVEGWLQDTTHLTEPDSEGVYSFSFQPYTYQDHQRLFEVIEQGKMEVMMSGSRFSSKDAKAFVEDKSGQPYCSQLFPPKLNVEVENPDQLRGRQVSLALHLRDDPIGRIYLQADYCDCYSLSNGVEPDEQEVENNPDEWDDWWVKQSPNPYDYKRW